MVGFLFFFWGGFIFRGFDSFRGFDAFRDSYCLGGFSYFFDLVFFIFLGGWCFLFFGWFDFLGIFCCWVFLFYQF